MGVFIIVRADVHSELTGSYFSREAYLTYIEYIMIQLNICKLEQIATVRIRCQIFVQVVLRYKNNAFVSLEEALSPRTGSCQKPEYGFESHPVRHILDKSHNMVLHLPAKEAWLIAIYRFKSCLIRHICSVGEIGIRARLRIWWRNPCGFKSHAEHHFENHV